MTYKYRILASLILASAISSPSASAADGASGVWDTSEGEVVFPIDTSGEIRARYSQDGGRLIGSLSGTIFTGIWVEEESSQPCEADRDGSDAWGRVSLIFDSDFSRFVGLWGYCQAAPKHDWTGTRIASSPKASEPLDPLPENLDDF